MKYYFIIFMTLIQLGLQAQNQQIERLQKEMNESQGADLVDKNLQLARAYYEIGEYQLASNLAAKVMELAPGLGLNKEMHEAQNLLIRSEQILALQNSRSKSNDMGSMAIALQLSDLFYKNGEFDKAARLAADAYQFAFKSDNKSFMATALNKEAKAAMKRGNPGKAEIDQAQEKFRKSMKIITENKVMDPMLKKDNLIYLEEFGNDFVRSSEYTEAKDAINSVFDSINIKLGQWPFHEMHPRTPESPDSVLPKSFVFSHSNSGRNENHEDLYNKIIVLNRNRMTKDLIAPLPPPASTGQGVQLMVEQVTDEMKELWPVQLKVIQDNFSENENRIEKLPSVEVRKELIQATYKNKYDSLMHLHILDSINLEKQELSIRQHEAEMERQKARRSLMMTGSGSTLLLSFFLLVGFTRQKKHNRLLSLKNVEIQREHERSDELLLNILPAKVADELKQFGESKAHRFDNVSVLFSDFIDFTQIAEKLSPEILVKELDYCFKAFDRIIHKYDLEKIKTIGDAYMCAGGLSESNSSQAVEIVHAAIEMQQFLNQWKEEKKTRGEHYFEARIGIHTGSVVAGVVGMKKYAYDIWGDTVNIASRMELSGEPGRINISGETYQRLNDSIPCSYRGKIKPKNKGEIDMYFVEEPN